MKYLVNVLFRMENEIRILTLIYLTSIGISLCERNLIDNFKRAQLDYKLYTELFNKSTL